MLRIRGLGQTLWRVIRRALGREVSSDADEAPQRCTNDVKHVDHAVDEIHKQPKEIVVDDVVADAEGFSGGPHDTLVLMDYVHHVAATVWNGEERAELKLSSHGRKVKKFGRLASEIEGLVAACYLDIGEVTITLDDMTSLLHLPITSAFHSFEAIQVDEVVDLLVDLLESVTHVHVVFLDAFCDLSQTKSYAWGAATLVYMYENLYDASKRSVRQLAGYITLLHCWIYEHFSTIASSIAAEDYHERKSCASRWEFGKALLVSTHRNRLDKLMSDAMCWISYGDHCMRPIYCNTPTIEGCAKFWVCANHSSTPYCSISMSVMCCTWTMWNIIHGVVLHDISSLHESNTAWESS
ncbi:Protein MAIN-LIKE 2 [Glycine soja]